MPYSSKPERNESEKTSFLEDIKVIEEQVAEKEAEEEEEWRVQLEMSKKKGDEAFRSSDYPTAISHYTQALSLDPNHHILLSNRSAAHLANHEKSKALADARLCIKSKPEFVKGYTRCASAVVSLGRYNEGIEIYRKVLKDLDPKNDVAKRGLEDCQKKIVQKRERESEMIRLELNRQMKDDETQRKINEETNERNKSLAQKKAEVCEGNDDDMDDFFSEVETVVKQSKSHPPQTKVSPIPSSPKEKVFKLDDTNLTTSAVQISHILQPSHAWLNLNPYHVLSISLAQALSPKCTLEIIEKRYRTISLLVHPDKNLGNIKQAELAFNELKKAMEILRQDDRRSHVLQLISQGIKISKKTAKQPSSLSADQWQDKCVKKIFAQVEQKRRDVEKRKKKQEDREKEQELEEITKLKKEKEYEKNWREGNRVEKRIGNWRDFQNASSSSSSRNSSSATNKKHKKN